MEWVVIKQVKLQVNLLLINYETILKQKTFIELDQAESWLSKTLKILISNYLNMLQRMKNMWYGHNVCMCPHI